MLGEILCINFMETGSMGWVLTVSQFAEISPSKIMLVLAMVIIIIMLVSVVQEFQIQALGLTDSSFTLQL